MPLTPSFSASQSPSNPGILVLTDTSTGSDVAISEKRVYVQNSVGDYIVEASNTTTDYSVWAIADSSISLNLFTNSIAASVRVDWVNSGGTVLYTSGNTYCFDLFSKNFLYSLVQGLVPPVTLDTVYSSNLAKLWTAVVGAENAITLASDLVASQACLSQAIYLQNNQNLFF
jgi:hypothetical protein